MCGAYIRGERLTRVAETVYKIAIGLLIGGPIAVTLCCMAMDACDREDAAYLQRTQQMLQRLDAARAAKESE